MEEKINNNNSVCRTFEGCCCATAPASQLAAAKAAAATAAAAAATVTVPIAVAPIELRVIRGSLLMAQS